MKKITIIAEIGINHNGSVHLAKKMVREAKKCGADIAKFQNSFPDQLFKLKTKAYRVSQKFVLRTSDYAEIKKYCDKLKIEFLCTPFDIKSVDQLEELNVRRYKVSSPDLVDMPLHNKILLTQKPVILSTGMANISEIKKTVNYYKKNGMLEITLLHCVSNYPCSIKSLNLKSMVKLKKIFNLPVGFSDHSVGSDAAIISVGLGATIIEKHFTIDKKLPGADHFMSMNPKEFSAFVQSIREAEIRLGLDKKRCQPEEKKFIGLARKSITLKKSMKRGEILKKKDIIMKRPGLGLNGQKINMVIGKKLKKNFSKEYQIKKQDLI